MSDILLIDLPLDRHMSDTNQSAEPGRIAVPPHMKHTDHRFSGLDSLFHLRPELGGDPFVGIDHEDPRMLVRRLIQPSVSLSRVVVEPSLNHAHAHFLCDRDRPIAAERIQNDDIVCLAHRPDTIGKAAFFVQRQDEDRQAHTLE